MRFIFPKGEGFNSLPFFVTFVQTLIIRDMSALNEYLKRLASIFGSMGFSAPPDDFSGVIINGETYPVMMRNDGCYVYFDEKGIKHSISDIPRRDYRFVNIKDARVSIVNQCYRTPGGQVEARIHTYMNNKGDILAEKIFIINSTDIDTPIGSEFDKIPDEWIPIDCSIAEMTDRELVFVSKCYATGTGKVQIEGIESVDPRLHPEISHYEVIRSEDPSNPMGKELDLIPDSWTRIVCDFPDMTQREILPVLKCFDTPTGRIQIEGYKIFDYEMGPRKEWYRIKQSTDPENPVGTIIRSIDEDWTEVVCDFTDMEDRDIEVTIECYKTPAGKVKLETLTSWDGNIGVRNKSYKVLETTDPSQPEGASFISLPDTWVRVVCDFTDMEDRDIEIVSECYGNGSKHIKLNHITSYDGKMDVRYERWEVTNSNTDDYRKGDKLDAVPSGYGLIDCDFIDYEDRMLQSRKECYDSGAGRVEVRKVVAYDGSLGIRTSHFVVVRSENPDVTIDRIYGSIPASWDRMVCDMTDMEDRIPIVTVECFEFASSVIRTNHVVSYDGDLKKRSEFWEIIDTDSNVNHAIGERLESIPLEWSRVRCSLERKDDRLSSVETECYSTPGGEVRMNVTRIFDPLNSVKSFLYRVISSTDKDIDVGRTYDNIQGFTRIECQEPNYMDRMLDATETCYNTGNGMVKIRRQESLNGNLDVKTFDYKIIDSTDPDYKVNTTPVQSVVDSWTVVSCGSSVVYVNEYYQGPTSSYNMNDMYPNTIHVVGYRSYDTVLNALKQRLLVINSTSSEYSVGDVLTDIPEGFHQVGNHMPELNDYHPISFETCLSIGEDKMQGTMVIWRTAYPYSSRISDENPRLFIVTRSNNANYVPGDIMLNLDGVVVPCDMPDLSQRHMLPVRDCYKTDAGRFYVEGYKMVNNSMVTESMSLFVGESSDPAYPEGMGLTSIPVGATRIPCLCQTC